MKGRLRCAFCSETTREHDFRSAPDIQWLTGLYLAHLIESHWPDLEAAREMRQQQGPVNDAWKRL